MPAATGTTNDENGRGDSRIAPTTGWPGIVLRGITHAAMELAQPAMKVAGRSLSVLGWRQ